MGIDIADIHMVGIEEPWRLNRVEPVVGDTGSAHDEGVDTHVEWGVTRGVFWRQ